MIRIANDGDASRISQMIRAMCIEVEEMGGHEVSSSEALWNDLPDKVIGWLGEDSEYLAVAESAEKEPVGFGHCRWYMLGAAFEPRKLMHIGSVFVKPRYRKMGHGKQLMEAMMTWGRKQNCEACELNVYINNPASEFYERLGFNPFIIQMKIEL